MADPRRYPVFLDVKDRPVLIVGGGGVGVRKARGLVEAGARVTVVSAEFCDDMRQMGRIELVEGVYDTHHMKMQEWRLAFAATNLAEINEQVCADARARSIWCCRCDEGERGDFVGAASTEVGGVTIAVATGGASPVVAARILKQAAGAVDPTVTLLAELFAGWRPRVKEAINEPAARRALLQKLAGPEMEQGLRERGREHAERLFDQWLRSAQAGGSA